MSPPPGRSRGWLLGVGLAGTACGSDTALDSTNQTEAPPGVSDGAAPPPRKGDAALPIDRQDAGGPVVSAPPDRCAAEDGGTAASISSFAVTHEDVGRRVIYSWTTAEQISELRADPTLLTRAMSSDGFRGRAADWILSRAGSDEFAAILARDEFANKRFGWSNPWATLLGWEGETYGTELLAITLKEEAFIGRVDAATGQWAFFDVDNQPVALDAVRTNPERIAAVYFVDPRPGGGCIGTFFGDEPFREYLVCNEGMIASWSAYTPELQDELVRGQAALRTVRDALADDRCQQATERFECWQDRVVAGWPAAPTDLLEAYETALAFPNQSYLPTLENLDRLIAAIDSALFAPDPLRHDYP